ncbi:MAG: hypothetical protein ACRDV8_12030 [Acidimicrobiales bacterium]
MAAVHEIDGGRIRAVVVIACAGVVAVTGCTGLLGGSGSNAAGYTCRGAFALRGLRYVATIPGLRDRPPGTTVHAITLASDPGLLATASQLSTERASAKVFLLPLLGVLMLVVVVPAAAILVARRRSGPYSPGNRPSGPSGRGGPLVRSGGCR